MSLQMYLDNLFFTLLEVHVSQNDTDVTCSTFFAYSSFPKEGNISRIVTPMQADPNDSIQNVRWYFVFPKKVSKY
jgi:hypothetical protein